MHKSSLSKITPGITPRRSPHHPSRCSSEPTYERLTGEFRVMRRDGHVSLGQLVTLPLLALIMTCLVSIFAGCSEPASQTCPPNFTYCDGACFNTSADTNHCGQCGVTCSVGQQCSLGMCVDVDPPPPPPPQCTAPLSDCGGQCINAQTDVNHCGQCGLVCGADELCVGGICSVVMEGCNGIDDDMDGKIDEGVDGGILRRSCSNLCGEGEEVCSSGSFVNCSAPEAELEVCDTLDNDCDGIVDEGVTETFFQDADSDGYGSPELSASIEACTRPQGYTQRSDDCDDQDRDRNPAALEVCDSVDNNCDQTVDEGCQCQDGEIVSCGSDEGICSPGTQVCQLGQLGTCGGSGYVAPEMEVCDDLDNDCDGMLDEDLSSDPREGAGNNTCATAHQLSPINDGDNLRVQNVNLYSPPGAGPDVDWFRVLAREANDELGLGNLACIDDQRQCYALILELTPPEGMPHEDIVACLTIDSVGPNCGADNFKVCTNQSDATFDAESNTYTIGVKWPGICVISDDSREFSVEVRGRDGNINSCRNYGMKLSHLRLAATDCPQNP